MPHELWNMLEDRVQAVEALRARTNPGEPVERFRRVDGELVNLCQRFAEPVAGDGPVSKVARRAFADHISRLRDVRSAMDDDGGEDGNEDSVDLDDTPLLLVSTMGVSFVLVQGIIWSGPCWEMEWFGGVTMGQLIAAVNAAAAADTSRVCLVINSPGGSAVGMDAVVKAVEGCAAAKPTSALVIGMAASGGYQVAALADEIVAVQSAAVGSIGSVLGADLIDDTQALKNEGVARYRIASGKLKRPSPGPIDDAVIKSYTAYMMECGYEPFREVVARGRELTPEAIDAMEGAVFGAKSALTNQLIDGVVDANEYVRSLMLAALAGGGGSAANQDRPEVKIMPKNELQEVLASASVDDIIKAKPEVEARIDAQVTAAVATKVAEANNKSQAASAEEIEKICGPDNKAMAFDLLKAGASVNAAYAAVNTELVRQRDAARNELATVKQVRSQGGGGGAAPVDGGLKNEGAAGGGDLLGQHRALVLECMRTDKVSVEIALARVNSNPKNMELRNAWLNAGAPEIKA